MSWSGVCRDEAKETSVIQNPRKATSATCTGGADLPMHEGPGASGPAGAPLGPHGPSSIFGEAGPLGTSGLTRKRTLLTRPDNIGDVRVGAMSSTLHIQKSKS